MKLPRDLSGVQLIKALQQLGYQATRQTGSHVRLTSQLPKEHHGMSRETLIARLFSR